MHSRYFPAASPVALTMYLQCAYNGKQTTCRVRSGRTGLWPSCCSRCRLGGSPPGIHTCRYARHRVHMRKSSSSCVASSRAAQNSSCTVCEPPDACQIRTARQLVHQVWWVAGRSLQYWAMAMSQLTNLIHSALARHHLLHWLSLQTSRHTCSTCITCRLCPMQFPVHWLQPFVQPITPPHTACGCSLHQHVTRRLCPRQYPVHWRASPMLMLLQCSCQQQ